MQVIFCHFILNFCHFFHFAFDFFVSLFLARPCHFFSIWVTWIVNCVEQLRVPFEKKKMASYLLHFLAIDFFPFDLWLIFVIYLFNWIDHAISLEFFFKLINKMEFSFFCTKKAITHCCHGQCSNGDEEEKKNRVKIQYWPTTMMFIYGERLCWNGEFIFIADVNRDRLEMWTNNWIWYSIWRGKGKERLEARDGQG